MDTDHSTTLQYKAYEALRRQEAAAAVGWGGLEHSAGDKSPRAANLNPPPPIGPPPSLPRQTNKAGGRKAVDEAVDPARGEQLLTSQQSVVGVRSTAAAADMSGEKSFYPDSGDQAARDQVSCIVDGQLYLTNYRGVSERGRERDGEREGVGGRKDGGTEGERKNEGQKRGKERALHTQD